MTLKDDDIVTSRIKPRRRFLKRIGSAAAGALVAVTVSPSAQAKRDARDFIPADSKVTDIDKRDRRRDGDKRSGDQA